MRFLHHQKPLTFHVQPRRALTPNGKIFAEKKGNMTDAPYTPSPPIFAVFGRFCLPFLRSLGVFRSYDFVVSVLIRNFVALTKNFICMKRFMFVLLCLLSAQVLLAQNYQSNDSIIHLNKRAGVRAEVEKVAQLNTDNLLARAGRMQRRSSTFRFLALASGVAAGIVAGSVDNKTGRSIAGGLGVVAVACEVTSILYQHKSGISLEASGAKVMLKF